MNSHSPPPPPRALADLLRVIEAAGVGFECVSQAELTHVRNVFPAISPTRVLFTPNFARREEYEFAFAVSLSPFHGRIPLLFSLKTLKTGG